MIANGDCSKLHGDNDAQDSTDVGSATSDVSSSSERFDSGRKDVDVASQHVVCRVGRSRRRKGPCTARPLERCIGAPVAGTEAVCVAAEKATVLDLPCSPKRMSQAALLRARQEALPVKLELPAHLARTPCSVNPFMPAKARPPFPEFGVAAAAALRKLDPSLPVKKQLPATDTMGIFSKPLRPR